MATFPISPICQKHAASAIWISENPVLETAEIGFESDTGLFKIGDGATEWTGLPYSAAAGIAPADATEDGHLWFASPTFDTAPSSATDTGTMGEIRVTADAIYICTATNTWVKAALASW